MVVESEGGCQGWGEVEKGGARQRWDTCVWI